MIRVVTTFGRRQWEEYASRLLPQSLALWPEEVDWQVWIDGDLRLGELPKGVEYKRLEEDSDWVAFMAGWRAKLANNPALANFIDHGQGGYLLNAGRFAHKVFALTSPAARAGADWLIFLGADVETTAPVDSAWLQSVLQGDLVHLGRTDIRSSETDFLGVFVKGIRPAFLTGLRHLYTSGDIFQWGEWIDGHLIGRLAAVLEGQGALVKNLSAGLKGLDVWEHTVLGERMTHWKGPRGKSALKHKLGTQ